jgi:F0F1-type ATP synthase assembly protein I
MRWYGAQRTNKDESLILELFIAAQGVVVISVSLAMFLWDGSGEATLSALAGGGSIWLANLAMVVWMQFRRVVGSQQPGALMSSASVLVAYFFKLLLSCILLWMSVTWLSPLNWLGFLSGLCFALTAIYLVPFVSSLSVFRSFSQRDFNQRVKVITSQSASPASR